MYFCFCKNIRIMKRFLFTLAALAFAVPSWAFKVYIFADMEGATGITCRPQVLNGEGAACMEEDINVCIAACFEAGATQVVVRDGHSSGCNVDPAKIDPRAELIQGPTPYERFRNISGSEAIIFLGYHAMSLTPNAILAHTYSSLSVQARYLNGREVGEIGIDASIAAEHNVPVVLVQGADDACREAREWIPGVVTCQSKKSLTTQSGKCLSPEKSHRLLARKTKEALSRRHKIALLSPEYPAVIRTELVAEGSVRTFDPAYVRNPDPEIVEATSPDSVEEALLGRPTASDQL